MSYWCGKPKSNFCDFLLQYFDNFLIPSYFFTDIGINSKRDEST